MKIAVLIIAGSVAMLQSIGQAPMVNSFPTPYVSAAQKKLDSLRNVLSGINFFVHINPANKILLNNNAIADNTARLIATNCGYFCNGVTLPATGLQLAGLRLNENQVQLNWKTITEINTQGFEIERSFSHTNSFTKNGFIQGAGNSVGELRYKIVDNNNYDGITYYRLKQLDKDGRFVYSNIVPVKGYLSIAEVSVNPNPGTQASSQIRLNGFRRNGTATLQITDVTGKTVVKKSNLAINGLTTIPLADFASLSSGFYTLTIGNQSQKATCTFVVVR